MNAQTEIGNEVETPTKWRAIRRWLTASAESFDFDPNEDTYSRLVALSKKVDEIEVRLVELEPERKS